MPIKVGINGFGRIGRVILRTCIDNDIKITAINDPAVDIAYICYLIKFDSTHGTFNGEVSHSGDEITINGHKIKVFHEKSPCNTPWHTVGVEYVVEASGMFNSLEKASGHLINANLKRVMLTAPSIDIPMMVLGVNDEKIEIDHKVISCASSTLYCLAPIIKILDDNYGVLEGFVTSIHAMTPSLKPLDGLCLKGKHWRDHRSIHQNIIPAATGACKALSKIIPQVKDKLTGLAFRVPIVNVSILDITIRLNTDTCVEDIMMIIEKESASSMKDIIKISRDEAVSSDFLGDKNSCILDANSSLQLSKNFFKLICWYENEYSYACRVVDTIKFSEKQLNLQSGSLLLGKTVLKTPRLSQSIIGSEKIKNFINKYHFRLPHVVGVGSSTSQDTVLKRGKPPLRYTESNQSTLTRDMSKNNSSKMRNEIVAFKQPLEHYKNARYSSCEAIDPCNFDCDYYIKTQERLDHVKREFNKMVTMTEDLLKKSNHDKLHLNMLDYVAEKDIKNNGSEQTIKFNETRDSTNEIIDKCHVTNNSGGERFELSAPITANMANINPELDANKETNKEELPKYAENIFESQIELSNNKLTHQKNNQILTQSNTTCGKVPLISKCDLDYKPKSNNNNNISCQENTSGVNLNSNHEGRNVSNTISELNTQNENVIVTKAVIKNCLNLDTVTKSQDSDSTSISCSKQSSSNNKNRIKNKILGRFISKLSIDTCSHKGTCDENRKAEIYDKLDSVSATDSDNSFQIDEKKSQVINIADISNSLEDLDRLDKICRIIEISDELSDELFSALDDTDDTIRTQKWSFKDLCERIQLDKFCNQVFNKPSS